MPRLTPPFVIKKLEKLYPYADCSLDFTNPLELLVATILSAQCTDKRVNIVTKSLFKKYKKPKDYVLVPIEELEHDIHSCGTYHMKAKAIQESCARIISEYNEKVPRSMDELLTLRGVGRKTAAIVLSSAYGIIDGVPVDTHVFRVSRRLGLTKWEDQKRIELDLMKKTPKKDWVHLAHLLVAHGRVVCIARRPRCEICVFKKICPSSLIRSPNPKKTLVRSPKRA